MLVFRNRLKKQKDFEDVFKNGRGFKQDLLYLKIKKNNLKSNRFGFIVSKKFSKKAVDRNKIKRILREIVRDKIPIIKTGFDAVIVVNPGAEKNFEKLEIMIDKLFKKSGLK